MPTPPRRRWFRYSPQGTFVASWPALFLGGLVFVFFILSLIVPNPSIKRATGVALGLTCIAIAMSGLRRGEAAFNGHRCSPTNDPVRYYIGIVVFGAGGALFVVAALMAPLAR